MVAERAVERVVEVEKKAVLESGESLTAAAPAPALAAAAEPTAAVGLKKGPPVTQSRAAVSPPPVTEAVVRQTASPVEAAAAVEPAPSVQAETPPGREASGVSLPLWQLEVAAGAIAALLALVAVGLYRRSSRPSGY